MSYLIKPFDHKPQMNFEAGFVILFSYDYFFLTHKCICEYLTTENITQASIENLKRALKCDAIK